MSRLPLATRLACDAKSLVAALRVGSDEYPRTAQVERHAGQLARTHGLRGADAVHLASALVIGDPDLVFAVWDERLHPEARAAWIRFTPLDLNV